MYERADLGGGQYAGSLRIAYRFETVSNSVVWGTTLRRRKLLQNGGLGQFEGWGWNVRGWYRPLKPRFKSLGEGVYHRTDCMQAARVGVDGGAGGSDR